MCGCLPVLQCGLRCCNLPTAVLLAPCSTFEASCGRRRRPAPARATPAVCMASRWWGQRWRGRLQAHVRCRSCGRWARRPGPPGCRRARLGPALHRSFCAMHPAAPVQPAATQADCRQRAKRRVCPDAPSRPCRSWRLGRWVRCWRAAGLRTATSGAPCSRRFRRAVCRRSGRCGSPAVSTSAATGLHPAAQAAMPSEQTAL